MREQRIEEACRREGRTDVTEGNRNCREVAKKGKGKDVLRRMTGCKKNGKAKGREGRKDEWGP